MSAGVSGWATAHQQSFAHMPEVMKRVQAVKKHRDLPVQSSPTQKTCSYADSFSREIRQPESDYLVIPEVSSERRNYIPIGFLTPKVICSNQVQYCFQTLLCSTSAS